MIIMRSRQRRIIVGDSWVKQGKWEEDVSSFFRGLKSKSRSTESLTGWVLWLSDPIRMIPSINHDLAHGTIKSQSNLIGHAVIEYVAIGQ